MLEMRQIIARRRRQDRVFNLVGIVCTSIGIVALLALLFTLMRDGLSRINWDFLTSHPSRHADEAGILLGWVGSVAVVCVTALTAVPLGVAAGVYLEEYAKKNRLTSAIEINISNLAAVPSIIYGLMALGVFVYFFGLGRSVLAGGLTLAVLILPIVIVATREALRTIPIHIREAAYSLGATKWQVIRHHLLPYSIGGISTGVILALSRAIGETAPLVTIGVPIFITLLPGSPLTSSFPFVSLKWLNSDFTVLPIQMYQWTSRPEHEFHVNAAAAGLVLIGMTLTLNLIAIVVRYRARKKIKW
jgi:phosphate transport system permease protein